MSDPQPFLWIVVVGGFVAFLMGAGVGMNDLSNAFGTTYGAKVLTLTQIIILASICEFAGSVSLGGAVTSTISGGIAKPTDFADHPYVFMYGMLCALGAAFCWLAIATWLTLPVSSTHSICGGVIGFALVYGGGDSVIWAGKKDDFPFVSGVVPIIASWFISPLLTGIVAAIIYGLVLVLVLRPKNSVVRATYSLPIVVAVAFFLESFFILYKGASKQLKWSVNKAAWVGAVIGGGAGLVSCAFIPILRRRIRSMERRALELAEEEGLSPEEAREALNFGENLAAQDEEAVRLQTLDTDQEHPMYPVRRPSQLKRAVSKISTRPFDFAVPPEAGRTPSQLKRAAAAHQGETAAVEVVDSHGHHFDPENPPAFTNDDEVPKQKSLNPEESTTGAVVREEDDSSDETPSPASKKGRKGWMKGKKSAAPPREGDDDGEHDCNEAMDTTNSEVPQTEQRHESGSRIFDSRAEYVYRYLQIFTAICASFAHGASDVSNAVGPFAAIYQVYRSGEVFASAETPIWVLALGGAGLIIGLSTFGVRLMRLLGEKITLITPSRGFSAELSAALVVSFASGYGIPVSSTHCITGAVIAISMVDVGFCKVKWLMVLKMYGGWVFTLVVTAIMSATFFSQGINSPNRH